MGLASSLVTTFTDLFERAQRLAQQARGAAAGDGDKSPFFFRGDTDRAVLCLHGFTGTPFEVRPLAEGLARRGYTVSAPLLAGHGTTPEALDGTRWPDWLASAAQALTALRAEVGERPIAVAGFSMGGLIALRLAHERPADVAALAVMAAPLRLTSRERNAIRLITHLPRPLRHGPLRAVPKRSFDVRDDDMRRRNPSLPVIPLDAAASLLDLAATVREALPAVRAPTLVAHGALDHTVPLDDSLELVGCLGSERIERLWLERSGHLLGLDVERATLVEAIDRFFVQTLGPARARPVTDGPAGPPPSEGTP